MLQIWNNLLVVTINSPAAKVQSYSLGIYQALLITKITGDPNGIITVDTIQMISLRDDV